MTKQGLNYRSRSMPIGVSCMTKQALTCRSRSAPSPASASGAEHHAPWASRSSEMQPRQCCPLRPPTTHTSRIGLPESLPSMSGCLPCFGCPLSFAVYCFWSSTSLTYLLFAVYSCLQLTWVPPGQCSSCSLCPWHKLGCAKHQAYLSLCNKLHKLFRVCSVMPGDWMLARSLLLGHTDRQSKGIQRAANLHLPEASLLLICRSYCLPFSPTFDTGISLQKMHLCVFS